MSDQRMYFYLPATGILLWLVFYIEEEMKIQNKWQRYFADENDAVETRTIKPARFRSTDDNIEVNTCDRKIAKRSGFRCLQCGGFVSIAREAAGVNNRNHCPVCLWSKHVDLKKAGDRLAECQSRMQPTGLTIKRTFKRYNAEKQGELMLIHCCLNCGKISINRIAADDDPTRILSVFLESCKGDDVVREELRKSNIELLGSGDTAIVHARLFGWQHIVDEMLAARHVPVHVNVDVE
jgi:hypothetical protein